MQNIKKILLFIFIAINILIVMAMNFCAYTAYLPPQTYPNWSYFGLIFPVFLVLDALFIVFWLVVKWKLASIPIVGMLLCAGSVRTYFPINIPATPPEGALKFMSYNVYGFGEKTNYAKWDDNQIINYIMLSDADIVCLQEADKIGLKPVKKLLEKFYPYQSYDKNAKAVMGCLSKYPILSAKVIDYVSNSNCSYAYEIKVNEDTILVVNNHLESYKLSDNDKAQYKEILKKPEDDDADEKYLSLVAKLAKANALRGAQADSIAAYIARSPHKYKIVCGDFNDSPLSYVHHTLTSELKDAYTESGNGPGLSYNRSGMYFRIDNILVSENIETYWAIVDKKIKKSDHYPISCYLKFE